MKYLSAQEMFKAYSDFVIFDYSRILMNVEVANVILNECMENNFNIIGLDFSLGESDDYMEFAGGYTVQGKNANERANDVRAILEKPLPYGATFVEFTFGKVTNQ